MFHIKKYLTSLSKDIIPKISLWLILILSFQLIVSIFLLTNLKNNLVNTSYEDSFKVIKIGIEEYMKKQNLELSFIVDNILDDVHNQYSSEEELKNDIDYIHEDSKFTKIVASNLKSKQNILLLSSEKILLGNFPSYNMDYTKSKNFFNIPLEEFYDNFNNKNLVETVFNKIFSLEPLINNKLLGFESNNSKLNLKEFNLDNIFSLYKNNTKSLDNIYFISYKYITENADIFSVPDYDNLGNPIDNSKLVLIQLFSIKDIDSELVQDELVDLRDDIIYIQNIIKNIELFFTYSFIISILSCGSLILVINIISNKKEKE